MPEHVIQELTGTAAEAQPLIVRAGTPTEGSPEPGALSELQGTALKEMHDIQNMVLVDTVQKPSVSSA